MIEGSRSFEDFFEQTHQRLFGGLCLITGNRHEAEDVMQDAYLQVWERWDRVGAMDEPIGFLFRLMGRDVLMRWKPRARETYWMPTAPAVDPASYFRQS